MFNLENKTALITGASGYFGQSFSKLLIDYGANVIILDRDNNIYDLANTLSEQYSNKIIIPIKADLYDEKNTKYVIEKSINNLNVDILINNAFEFSKDTGFNDESGKFEFMSKEQWM